MAGDEDRNKMKELTGGPGRVWKWETFKHHRLSMTNKGKTKDRGWDKNILEKDYHDETGQKTKQRPAKEVALLPGK